MRNPNSEFYLSIRVSYPNSGDLREAGEAGVDPGGAIMIHGQPNVPTKSETYYRTRDWTNGCIAVSNSDMIDIWLMTADDTPIEIRP
jgi:murein L,D-transpeptidase YafK